MVDVKSQTRDNLVNPRPSATPQDYYALLTEAINNVTRDHAKLRKLVYELAWQNLQPEQLVATPIEVTQSQPRTIFELERTLQLERAIERIEVEVIERESKEPNKSWISDVRASGTLAPADEATISQPADGLSPAALAEHVPISRIVPEPPTRVAKDVRPKDIDAIDLDEARAAAKTAMQPDTETAGLDASFGQARPGGTLALPEHRSGPGYTNVVRLERIPSWLDPNMRVSVATLEYGPMHRLPERRSNVFLFLQLIAASFIGVMFYIGISEWMFVDRHRSSTPVPTIALRHDTASDRLYAAQFSPGSSQVATQTAPPPEPQPILPFPLPRTYGIYAGVPGQLFELEPLPIKVPDPRVQVSAEITKASNVTMHGENVTFVVFRRDLVNSAPQIANVRVVAQVRRSTKFVNGKLATVPIEGVWRIRSNVYEFKVSPLEGRNEMVLVQPNPGFVFPPGRYALVLNGSGYDFTIAGSVTAPEHCLEQVEVVNGTVLSECPKIR